MIRTREAVATLVTAAVTLVAALALLWPMGVGAADEAAAMRILQPSITIGSCQFTIETPLKAEPGARPVIRFKAVNTGSTTTEATVWLVVSATEPSSPMSRRMPEPQTVWAHGCTVRVAAGAIETYKVPIEADLPAGQTIMVSLANTAPPAPGQGP